MAKKKKSTKKEEKEYTEIEDFIDNNSDKIRNVFLVLVALFIIISCLSLFGLSGKFGDVFDQILTYIFGIGKWLFPFFLLSLFVFYIQDKKVHKTVALGSVFVFFSLLSFINLFNLFPSLNHGGIIGLYFLFPFINIMGSIASFFILLAFFLAGLVLAIDIPVKDIINNFIEFIKNKREVQVEDDSFEEETPFVLNKKENITLPIEEPKNNIITSALSIINPEKEEKKKEKIPLSGGDIQLSSIKKLNIPKKDLYLPVDLLKDVKSQASAGDVNANLNIIQSTLKNFGIDVTMGEYKVGPTVTQYSFKPAEGVKLAKVVALQNDLALALSANSIRMEAPIPGKALVGIEVPNKISAIVTMKELINSDEFKNRKSNLNLLLGKDVSGKPFIADLAKMPHLLIAGATGTGKSVCIHGVISSLMFQNSPDDLKFIMIDPKRVEMTLYNGIPYLLTPPVTDPKKIVNSLKWAVSEMDRRYQVLADAKKVNLVSYNESVSEEEKMPYIVIVIDELADLMMLSRGEVEPCIIRIAQLARAIGIHLILATQRPSVNVITGLIKANVPARIAFSVASSIDSRTVLDATGAERLIGKGDMLYSAADTPKPIRMQGAYVSDDEIRELVLHLKTLDYTVDYDESIVERKTGISQGGTSNPSGFSADDDLFDEVIEEVMRSKKASTSLLQRKFSIGYARAARLMDLLEEAGVVGPSNGAKPREILIDTAPSSGGDITDDVDEDVSSELGRKDENNNF